MINDQPKTQAEIIQEHIDAANELLDTEHDLESFSLSIVHFAKALLAMMEATTLTAAQLVNLKEQIDKLIERIQEGTVYFNPSKKMRN